MDCIDSETPELNFVDKEVVIDSKASENVIDGNSFLNLDEWNSITEVSGDEYTFLKDWTNLFGSKLLDLFVCVLCFKYKRFNKFGSRKQNC